MALSLGFSVTALRVPAAGGHPGCLQAPSFFILLPSTSSRRGFAAGPRAQSVSVNDGGGAWRASCSPGCLVWLGGKPLATLAGLWSGACGPTPLAWAELCPWWVLTPLRPRCFPGRPSAWLWAQLPNRGTHSSPLKLGLLRSRCPALCLDTRCDPSLASVRGCQHSHHPETDPGGVSASGLDMYGVAVSKKCRPFWVGSVHGVQGTCATVTRMCARVGWAFSVPTSQSPLRLSGTEVSCD